MLKKNLKVMITSSIVSLMPIIAGLILWDKLPIELPIHWNASGEVDGYASRAFVVFGVPAIMTALHWFAVMMTELDPKRKNHSEKMMILVYWLVPVISLVLFFAIYATALGADACIEIILPAFLGLVFVFIGNYLPKCKQNHTVGIRLPWTLNSEENWNRTHRVGGFVMVIGGLVTIATSFFGIIWLPVAILLAVVLVPIIYSLILYKKGI